MPHTRGQSSIVPKCVHDYISEEDWAIMAEAQQNAVLHITVLNTDFNQCLCA